MKLYYTKMSPYAHRVRMVISEIGVEQQIELIDAHPFNNTQSVLEANPLGKIPCLLSDDGAILDSEVICDYLDATTTGGQLFNAVYADWRLKTLYSICSGLMDAIVARRMEFMREEEGSKSEFWWQRFNDAITRTLTEIESKLPIFPEDYCILHINLLSSLAYLNFRHQDIDWRKNHPALAEFFDQHSQRESFINNPLSA